MTEPREQRMCVLLPCGPGRHWAVPQNCLAEILTLPAGESAAPPRRIDWRGVEIPVLDFGAMGEPWRDGRSGTGLVAVILGVPGAGYDYWGVALRGPGLAVRHIDEADCQDLPEAVQAHSLAAFTLDGETYQVPDLPALQQLTLELETAVSA